MATVGLLTTRSLALFATNWRNPALLTKAAQKRRWDRCCHLEAWVRSSCQVDEKSAKVHDAKASLLGLPDASFVVYLALNVIVWLLIWQSAAGNVPPHHLLNPHLLAFLASAGPVVLAQLMVWTLDPHRPILYPFQRQALNIAIAHILSNMPSSGTPTELLPCIWFYLSSFVLGQSTHW